ncbi:MAG: carbohydrate kinase [Clostridia bacterium]|nr:carbohydrate kinase [Clostridia bacterium]
MKQYDVAALGELLIDFTESGTSASGNRLLEANPGGAPCNVLSMLQKLGRHTAFIGKVGQDAFGDMLEAALAEAGISTLGLKRDERVHTTLAFVHTLAGGERSFSFYRNPGADMRLSAEDLEETLLSSCRIFHFGTLSLTDEPCREATRTAVRRAKQAGALISFDPNLRESLWDSLDHAREEIDWGLSQCDILKISDNELAFMTGTEDFDKGAAQIRKDHPQIRMLNVTAGENGSLSYVGNLRCRVPVFSVPAVEKTGAGDTFCACALDYVLEHGLDNLSQRDLQEMLTFANAAAALIIQRKGALKVMPSEEEIRQLLSRGQA